MKIRELHEKFGGLEALKSDDLEHMNTLEPKAGPVLMAAYKGGQRDTILVLGVDPDEGRIRVAVDNPDRGSTWTKYFDDDAEGYEAAKKYAESLRVKKVNVSEARKSVDHQKNHKFITDNLESYATGKGDGLESDDHALYGYLHSRDGKKISVNIIDPTDSGSYTLELSKNGGRTNFYVEDSLSTEEVVSVVDKIFRNMDQY